MWRWSFSSVRELSDNFKPDVRFPAVTKNRKLEKPLSDWAACHKAIGDIYLPKKWKAETLQTGLEFDNSKPLLESVIFKCISWLNDSFFAGDDRGFLSQGTSPTRSLSLYL